MEARGEGSAEGSAEKKNGGSWGDTRITPPGPAVAHFHTEVGPPCIAAGAELWTGRRPVYKRNAGNESGMY